jgi:hypothetical protein
MVIKKVAAGDVQSVKVFLPAANQPAGSER